MDKVASLRRDRMVAYSCFFLSGATGLVYEVVWTRLFGQVIGNTHFSITVVVSAFMAGLAAGSWIGGRVADRSPNPLRLYGVLTLCVAAACLLVPALLHAARPLLGWLYRLHDGAPEAPVLLAAKIAVSAIALLVPTTFMGATLPALSRHFARRFERVGAAVGTLYALNTFGAVAGAVFAGFAGVRFLGIYGSIALGVAVDVAIGIAVIAAARTASAPLSVGERTAAGRAGAAAIPPRERGPLPLDARLAVIAFGTVGFADMLLQIAWTKALVLSIGNSTYAFSLIVSLFILGIALGGGAVSLFADRWKNPLLALGILIALAAASVSATIPLLGYLPVIAARAFDRISEPSYGRFLAVHLALVSAVILPSTILMGTVFPVVGRIRTQAIEKVGSAIGSAYFANTLGSILGTLAAGFLCIPLFGRVSYTLYLGAALSLATGAILIARGLRAPLPARLAAFAAVAAAVAVPSYFLRPHGVLGASGPLWHPAILSRGAYAYYKGAYWGPSGKPVSAAEYVRGVIATNEVLFFREGIHAPVAVVRSPRGEIALRISGKVEASLSGEGRQTNDAPHQLLAGHLPMVLHPDPARVLTLGLGGGVTLGTLTVYPVDSIDSLEISPEVIEAARVYFREANRGAIEDPKVRHVVGDGRNHLEYTARSYDVITSVPSNPWIAGIGNLFTVEFFRTCRARLREGGVLCNWIHKIAMREEDFRTVVRTFLQAFGDHAQLWDLGYDALLVGSVAPIRFDAERLRELLRNPEIAEDLAALGIDGPETFLCHFLFDAAALREYAGPGPSVNTDSFPILEFSCPYGLYGHPLDAFASLARAKPAEISPSWVAAAEAEIERARDLRTAFQACLRAEGRILPSGLEIARELGRAAAILRRRADPWIEARGIRVASAALGVPAGATLDATLSAYYLKLAATRDSAGPERREQLLEAAGNHLYGSEENVRLFAYRWLEAGKPGRGIPALRARLEETPSDAVLLHMLAVLQAASGDLPSAAPTFEKALEATRDAKKRGDILHDAGYALELAGQLEAALRLYERALAENPENAAARARRDAIRKKLER